MIRRALVSCIRSYQRNVPMLLRGRCIFTPTCSDFALLALEKHGAVKGVAVTLRRLVRCNPFGRGGEDWP